MKERRKKLLSLLQKQGGGIALIKAATVKIKNSDTDYHFRQASSFFYFTGMNEPDAILLLQSNESGDQQKSILFVHDRDPQMERWTGKRVGVEQAPHQFAVDQAYDLKNFELEFFRLAEGHECLYLELGQDEVFERKTFDWFSQFLHGPHRRKKMPQKLVNLAPLVAELRMKKSAEEIVLMKKAQLITGEAFLMAMKNTYPGQYEYALQGMMEGHYRTSGAMGYAYPSIVAGGNNATCYHYSQNSEVLKDGELVLIDSGAEFQYYSADITRTFPVGRCFTPAQRDLYQLVLNAQVASIEMIRPGVTLNQIHQKTLDILIDGLIDLKVLSGSREQIIEQKSYRPYYGHSTSHFLGLDTHDVSHKNNDAPLAAGEVITVEPGLYFDRMDSAQYPTVYAGFGIRIEDDILVTDTGYENLSEKVPKTIEQIEALRARGNE